MIRVGVISPSDIAFRRFMPALMTNGDFRYVGLAIYSKEERFRDENVPIDEQEQTVKREQEKGRRFLDAYGGRLFESYHALITSDEIDAVYLPLPPALHYIYGKQVLEHGKHLLVEKPATVSLRQSTELLDLAVRKHLTICENYMFIFHRQINAIQRMLSDHVIGDVRLLSMKFGFPRRAENDFRYKKTLGGGALFDACGYPVRLAMLLLGKECDVLCAHSNMVDGYEVDMYGTATLINPDGVTAQIAFGMDNEYRCELEIWGSKGTFKTGRIFTAPKEFMTNGVILHQGEERKIELGTDDAFENSLQYFHMCILDQTRREEARNTIARQARLIEKIKDMSGVIA